jgi:hypothetical protein
MIHAKLIFQYFTSTIQTSPIFSGVGRNFQAEQDKKNTPFPSYLESERTAKSS